MSVPDPGMWELCVFFVLGFACFLAWPFRLVVRCWLLLLLLYACARVVGFVCCMWWCCLLGVSCCGLLPLSLVFRGGAVRFSLFWPSVVCLFSFCFLVFRFPFW